MLTTSALVNGQPADQLPIGDRGFCYGDGLFETIRISAGQPVWWDAHLARLARGCEVLGLDMPDPALLAAELRQVCGDRDGVLRLTLTRTDGGRGYLPSTRDTRRILALHPPVPLLRERAHQDAPYGRAAPRTQQDAHHEGFASNHRAHPDAPCGSAAPRTQQDARHDGSASIHRAHLDAPCAQPRLAIGWATLQLAIQPRLAGLKHLNRLEQVLAAGECRDRGMDELLLCDSDGAVTSGIAANLFLVRAGRLETPLLDRCGVAGTCRAWILQQHPECQVRRLRREDVEAADELFLCNSVRGILPVARLATRALPAGPVAQALARRLGKAVPALAAEPEQ